MNTYIATTSKSFRKLNTNNSGRLSVDKLTHRD
jgi:hypothetical protein